MKRVLLALTALVCILSSQTAYAQPGAMSINQDVSGTYTNSGMTLAGGAFRARFQENATGTASGTRNWQFNADAYFNQWGTTAAAGVQTLTSYNSVIAPNTGTASGNFYTTGYNSNGRLPATQANFYYTYNISRGSSYASQRMAILETSYNPVNISSVAQAAGANGSRTITITTSATPAAGENIYVRYSTNSYASSTIVLATGSGTTWTATIPWQTATVSFYAYTSNRSLAAINADVASFATQEIHDLSTLNLNNNGGTNYSWTPTLVAGNVVVFSAGGSGAAGVGYATLTVAAGAFAALNGGTAHTGAVSMYITADLTVETGATPLNNSAAWTSMTVNPIGTRTVSGTVALPLLDIVGADNVTFDGLNTGGNSLTISNLSTAATSGTSTIKFSGDAIGNTITNCSILGSSTMAVGTNGGNIFISTGTTNGNDNLTISNCNIGPAGVNLPSKGIYGNGSTGTTAIGNSGITITNNNIFDCFAAATTSSGIYVAAGCNTWSITNNRFYQTAARTWTTGAQNSGIWIIPATATSGAQGFTITGNTIGYATNTQTGTYTLSGSTGKFIGIFYNGITGGALTTISSNTIAAISCTGVTTSGTGTSSPFMAVFISNGLVTSNSNIIGSQTTTGSIVFGTTAIAATDYYAFYNFSSDIWTANSNQIGGITINTGASGAHIFYGLRANTASTATFNLDGNLIGGTIANSINNTSASTTARVIGISNDLAIVNFTNNTLRNMTMVGANTGTGTSASVIGINNIPTSAVGHTITGNTIHSLSNTAAAAAVSVIGIHYATTTGGTNVFSRNFIHSLSLSSSSATAEIRGINTNNGTLTYENNMIRLGIDAAGASLTNNIVINGIFDGVGTNSFLHNTVYIGGTGVGTGAANTTAFNSQVTVNNRIFRNNIFWNARSNGAGTGKHYGTRYGGSSANPTGLTASHNLIFTSGTGGVFGFFNLADVASLSAWQTATGQDASSIFGNPQLINPTGTLATVDLHIHASNPTSIEGAGTATNTTTADFDGQTRTSLTPVDIGADAGNFVPNDISAPSITYTTLANTCSTGDATLSSVTITDASGVPTTGSLVPRIYYRKGAGSWFSQPGTLSSGSATNGSWSFTIVAADMGGLAVTDVVSYYVIAQDVATTPNIASNAAGATATNVNTVSAAPGTPATYTVLATISGTYTVGAAGNYTTLTAAVAAFNSSCVIGAVVFNLIDNSYTTGETFPITINNNVASSSSNTLTIKPTLTNTVISGSVNGTLIRLNGADYVTIDGSTSGGTDRNLSINNTFGTGTAQAILISSLGAGLGANNNTIKNLNIQAGTTGNGNTTYGISVGSTAGATGADNDNTTIQNNVITNASIGIYAAGTTSVSAGGMDNLVVLGNSVTNNTTTVANAIGIQVSNGLNGSISQNTLSIRTSNTIQPVGISLETGFVSSTVTRNNITQVLTTNAGGYGGRGITVGTGTATSAITIANNFISGVNGTNWNTFGGTSSAGIWIGTIGGSTTLTTTTGGVSLYYNTVSMAGSMGTASTTAITAALYVGINASALDIRNNIFSNTQTGTAVGQKNYAIYSAATNTAFTTINYNDYWVSNSFNAGSAVLGFIGSDRTTLAAIVLGFGQNANSINSVANFTSASDLHLVPGTNAALNGSATPIAGYAIDYDNTARHASTPDIGADEFVPATDDAGVVNIQMPPTFCAGSVDVKADIQNFGIVNLNTVTINWTVNGVAQTALTPSLNGGLGLAPGNTEIVLLGNFNFVAGTVYTIVVTSSLPNGNTDVNTGNDSFTLANIQTGLAGTYTVGAGGNFTTLTAAVNAFNTRSLCGAVTFNLIDASYAGETYPITLNNNANSSATNTLTIKATQAGTTFTGSSASALVVLNGADYVTIDGSIAGTANTVCPASTASRDLTFNNTNAGASSAVIWLQTAASGTTPAATNNTIKNCNLNGSGAFQTLIGVGAGSATIGTSSFGNGNNNNSYVNNNITNTGYGIYSQGASAGSKNSGTVISLNQMTTTASMKGGIWTGFENNITITGNSISNVLSSGSLDVFGITCGFGTAMSTTSTAGNEVTNATITNNTIGSVANTGTFSAYGIGISTSATGTNLITNNMVYGVGSNGTGGDFAAGIVLGGGAATTNVFYNTVSMQGTIAGTNAATQASACFAITNITGPTVNIRNNIFTNTQLGNSGATLKLMAIGLAQTTFAGFTCNNNVLYSAGAGPGTYMVGITGGISTGTARTTLANWQGATGTDAASVSILPAFISSTNLRVDGSNFVNGPIDNIGAVVSTTTDLDCATRSATTPDPGVNEFAVPVCFGTPTAGTASAAPAGPFCGSANTTLSIAGATGAVGITYQWQSSVTGLAGSFANVTGATSSTLVLTGLSTTNYYQSIVTCSYSALSDTTTVVGVIVNPNPTITVTPSAPVLCGPGATALTASGADTYSWSPATGLSATTGASVTATLTSTTTYTVTGTTTATGCQGSTNVTVFVAPAATPVTVVATPDPVCQGSVVNLSATVPTGTLTVLSENFNGGTNNWTTTNTSSGGTPANAAWTLRPNGYTYSGTVVETFNSNDNTQFYLSNSDSQNSGTTRTTLVSPSINLSGYSAASLSYFHYYEDGGTTADSAKVEVSTNGTSWTLVQAHTTTQGLGTAFVNSSVNLNAFAGQPTVFLRFSYKASWDWYWAIDNVTVTTPITYTYAWSSDVGGFTSTAAAPTHSPNVNTDYTVTVTNNFGCIGTDNEPVAVIPAPAVFAGPDQNTCGTGAYAITGATAQNTTSVNWTTTGSGTFTGTGTLTPSYSPTGAEIGTSITFYLNGVGNAPCLAASDSLVLTVAPLNTYYLDNDGDGFGNPFLSATGCTAPVGYVTDNTDCNDSNAALNPYTNWYGDFDGDGYGSFVFLTSCTNPGLAGVVQQGGDCDDNNIAVFPGSPEICQNYIDDNCDGQVDENCSGLVNDNRVNAIAVTGSLTSFPACASISGSCLNAAISPEGSSAYVAAGGGRDAWYKFVAPSPGVQIKLNPSGFNGLIELQTAAGVYIDHENANTASSGLDILNRAGLTTGATYFVAVRNYDNSAGGTFTLCISPLMDSNCDNGSGTYPMCSNLKADYTGANNYTFNFDPTGATTGSNTSGTAVGQIYLTPSAPLNLQYGGTYNVTIDANYTGLVNGLGSADPIVIPGTEICSITMTAQPNVQTKATQLCSAPATLLKGSVLQGKPFVCSAINFTLEFTQLTACAAGTSIGMPFYGTTTGASASINLSTVAGVTGGGKWYQVRWRPNFSSGPGAYGTPSVIYVGGAVMGTDDGNVSMTNSEKNVAGIEAAIYPNPNNGEMLNLNLTNVDAKEVYVRITDGMGKLIYTHQYIVEGSLNTQVTFEQQLSAGLYLVEFISNGEVTTQKMIVER